jgi:hypothetical protein
VANFYGATSIEATLANEFFGPSYAGVATMMFTRFGLGQRPHLLGANIGSLTQLQGINGSIALTFNGYRYSGHINLSSATSFVDAAKKIQVALNSNLQVAAVTSGSTIVPETVTFTGYVNEAQLYVTQVLSGTLELGGIISGHGIAPEAYPFDSGPAICSVSEVGRA